MQQNWFTFRQQQQEENIHTHTLWEAEALYTIKVMKTCAAQNRAKITALIKTNYVFFPH